MASEQILQLFKAIYDGNLSSVKAFHQDGMDFADTNFVIETDEVCLCGTAFENLGLEFTTLASPTRDRPHRNRSENRLFWENEQHVKRLDLFCDNGSESKNVTEPEKSDSIDKDSEVTQTHEGDPSVGETPTLTLTDTGNDGVTTPLTENPMTSSAMSSSFMSDGRRVYEPPLRHWLEQGRCSHICEQNDLDFDYLEDLEELQDGGDDLDKDLDLEVYGIRLSPNPLTEDGMSVSISSDINDRLRSLQMSDSIEETCEETAEGNSDESPSLTSSGPSVHVNADLFAYLQKHYSDDDSIVVQTPKLPQIHDFDSLGSDTGSGVLVGSIKVASVSPLHVAAARGHVDIVSFLLEHGSEVNGLTSDTKEAPLHLACRWGRCDVAKTLLKHGADPVVTSAVDCSPMHVAIELSCCTCLAAMLEKLPAEEDLDVRVKETLLVYAVVRDNVTLLNSLLDKFKINIKETLVVEAGQTYLHKAAASGAVRCVHLLADRGSSLDATSPEGETALHMAASCGHLGAVQALLKAGAVPRTSANWMIGDNQTPLMLAAYHNCPEVVQALLPHDDVNCQSECGDTALHYCAFRGCFDGVKGLIASGANVNLHNQYGATALWNGSCYVDIVKLLIKSGASTKVKSVGHDLDHLRGAVYNTPRNPLEITLEEGFLETSIVLLQAGCTLSRMRALQLLDQGHKRYDLENDLYESVRKSLRSVIALKRQCRRRIVKALEKHDDSIRNKLVDKLPVIDDELKAYLCFSDL